jgi:NADH-quinone oxidoreductase subunit M
MITALLILIPVLGSVPVMLSGRRRNVKPAALAVSLAEFVVSIIALWKFRSTGDPEFSFSLPWMPGSGINFHFAMDGISLLMVLLTAFLFPVIIAAYAPPRSGRINVLYGLMLIFEASLIGVFTAQDGIVFYIFWELALIPAYFITALWGGKDRIRITFKFFIYTMTGSLIMLGAMIWLYLHTPDPHSAEIAALCKVATTQGTQLWLFGAFFLAFAIKIPIIPFHTWQPDTYTEAPAGGTMILSGIMLKMGIYGVIRLLIPLGRDAFGVMQNGIILLIVAGIVYASIIALNQTDLKRFAAWVSIAHAGLITAGAFTLEQSALQGAVIQMISHGINIVGLFIIIDIIERKYKTRDINELGGLARINPWLGIFFMIILLGTVALPVTNGFPGEFLLLLGLFRFNPWIATIAGTTIILGAVYMLRVYQKVMLGPSPEKPESFENKLTGYELSALLPLTIMVFLTGCFPDYVLGLAGPAVKNLLDLLIAIPN